MTEYSIKQIDQTAFYEIRTVAGDFVGTYATEEKAKRRIRDLKRADAAKVSDDDQMARVVAETTDPHDLPANPAPLYRGDKLSVSGLRADPLKLALSSPYGKSNIEPREYDRETIVRLSAISADFGTIDAGHLRHPAFRPIAYGKVNEIVEHYHAIKPRNGFRPAHRANRFRSARR